MKNDGQQHVSKYSGNLSGFVDLTPVDDADFYGSYSKALEFALGNDRIKNIAITGPYGSGKSSIIRTFEKKNSSNYRFLNISLASFKETDDTKSDDGTQSRLIERSILQQMLYGADANNLPYSRFKRISTPVQPLLKSLIFVLWAIGTYGLYEYGSELLNLTLFSNYWWGGIGLIALVMSMPVVLVADIYRASFGISLKKISLTNGAIETCAPSEDSILNRHLDEIIYFFQATDYCVVVIEDLDRFDDPEIFVKLREINKLINDNDKTDGNIKFLYAIRDDMFAHKNRAKFFDFIIPVVPVINSFNSLDMMQERLKALPFTIDVCGQFLREVSFYIDDMRLIHNIFNEYTIYYNRLMSENLDATKLLAIMIYKNVYPNDFENLHSGGGALFEICRKKTEYLQKNKDELKRQTVKLQNSLDLAAKETAKSIRELINMYVGHIVMYANQPVSGIVCKNQHLDFNHFDSFEKFEPLLSESNIQLAIRQGNNPGHRFAIGKSFAQIEQEINPGETFLNRKESIDNKQETQNNELQKEIQLVVNIIKDLPQKRLAQILQSSELKIDDVFTGNGIGDARLFNYLVVNGFLDDNYYLYTSNFHEGRMTVNDREFIITIRNFNQPDPSQKVDTPKEVCASMRDEDFGQKYVLNVTLIDYLLEDEPTNNGRIKRAMQYFSANFKQSEEFFNAYRLSGKKLDIFTRKLSDVWPEFASVAIPSKHAAEIVSLILQFVDARYVAQKMNTDGMLSSYLAEHGHHVFASNFQLPEKYDVLKDLGVQLKSLPSLEKNKSLLNYLHEKSLYTITTENVNYVMQKYSKESLDSGLSFEKSNYTSICAAGSDFLNEHIKENLSEYIEKVFLTLPENINEDVDVIKNLLNSEEILDAQKENIISKQENVFETFEGIPSCLWGQLLVEDKVIVTWGNISSYFGSDEFSEALLTEFLNNPHNIELLSQQKINIEELGKDESNALSKFVFNNNEINSLDYCKLIKSLPYWYHDFPENVTDEKLVCLARERTVRLTEESFDTAEDKSGLVAILIENNFDDYLTNKDSYDIDDEIRELLLQSNLSERYKILLCRDVTADGVLNSRSLSLLVSTRLLSNRIDLASIDIQVLSGTIVNSQPTNDFIHLLIKCIPLWDEEATMEILSKLKKPYNQIASYGKRPKLKKNELNVQFANLLESKGLISSMKVELNSVRINTWKSVDR